MGNLNRARNRTSQGKERYGLGLSLITVAVFLLSACSPFNSSKSSDRGPELEIKGETAWYKGTPEEKQYILKTFKDSTGIQTISWPPEELRRVVDISVDITGSGYMREVLFDGKRMPLAEYNLRKFREYLLDSKILQPGDIIFVRLFGARPGGRDIDVDEYKKIDCPGLQVEIQVTVFERRYHDVEIVASKIISDPQASPEQVADSVFNWFLPYVTVKRPPNEVFMQSPLLQHIYRVCQLHNSKNLANKLYIFVTDGQFQSGDYYFSPDNYSRGRVSLGAVKRTVGEMKIKPFTESDRTSSIILYGLSSNGNEEFRQAQEQIFRWFFDPLDPKSVELIFH